jgi:hypothetical protein
LSAPTHIVIVGTGRSGTTLARNLLNSSPHMAICGELRFLRQSWLRPGFRLQLRRAGDLSSEEGVWRVVDRIYNDVPPRSFWRWLQHNVEREEFARKLLATDRTERALFDLVMELFADGKPIRGEKTPPHIYAVPTLLRWFPEARVVHMIRDPRAVYVSSRTKRFNGSWDTPKYRQLRRSWLVLSLYEGL